MTAKSQAIPRLFGCDTISPLCFSVCGQLISPSGFLHQRRVMDQNVLIMVTEGTLYITANSTQYALSPGQYILLRSGEEHCGYRPSEGRLSYLWAHFRADREFRTVSGGSGQYTYLLPAVRYRADCAAFPPANGYVAGGQPVFPGYARLCHEPAAYGAFAGIFP